MGNKEYTNSSNIEPAENVNTWKTKKILEERYADVFHGTYIEKEGGGGNGCGVDHSNTGIVN
jgi:hypothetical protein